MEDRYAIIPTEYTDGVEYFIKDIIDDKFIPICRYPKKEWKTYNKGIAEHLCRQWNDKWKYEGKFQTS